MKYSLVSRLLRRNTSPARIAGFLLSNFIGLTIVAGALQFYADARHFWTDDDSFIRSDYMVVNKRVSSANTMNTEASAFSDEEISQLREQPWVRKVGAFSKANFKVSASVSVGDIKGGDSSSSLSTAMFFEAVPDEFLDFSADDWRWSPKSAEVPVVISKDYLALYNFGFASAAGLPQLSGTTVSGIPLTLRLSPQSGGNRLTLNGRVAGYSSRFNTILVPQSFIDYMNEYMGAPQTGAPSRLIVDVSSPGDTRISQWLEDHDMEVAGDKTATSASFLLKVIVGIVIAVGSVISLLSLFILMLSISLLMEKNRAKLHSLLMLGYDLRAVGRPYRSIIAVSSVGAALLSLGCIALMRACYLPSLRALGAGDGSFWIAPLTLLLMCAVIVAFNIMAVSRRVTSAWRHS